MPRLRAAALSIVLGVALLGSFTQMSNASPSTNNSAHANSASDTQTVPAVGGSNIFSSSADSNETPTYKEDKGGNARLKKLILGDAGKIPEFKTVRTIPSLTPPQRKQIREIYEASKTQLAPLVQQMRALKPQGQGGNGNAPQAAKNSNGSANDGSAMADNATIAMDPEQRRETFLQLRQQIRHIREQTWQQVKSVLSDKQLGELEAMQRGELQPATFNNPQMAVNRQRVINGGANGSGPWMGRGNTNNNSGSPNQMNQQDNN